MLKFVDKIEPSRTAVLVLDMINGCVSPDAPACVPAGTRLAPKLGKFLDVCREKGICVIYAVQSYRADGADLQRNNRRCDWSRNGTAFIEGTWDCEIYEPCSPKEGEIVVKKHHYNAFYNTDLNIILQAAEIDTVAITGVCTDVSCLYTAREAFYLNYKTLVIEDLNGTRAWPDFGYGTVTCREQHLAAINSLAATGAQIMSSEEFCSSIE